MEKGQTYVIAAAIIVAGLIIAAAILAVGQPSQVGRFAFAEGLNNVVIDTQTGDVWGRATALPDLERTIGLPISSIVEEVGKHQGSEDTNAEPHSGDQP